MAKELARFQNFAKLKDTQIAFNDITVLAGKPGTGKSYVMKFMYAIDETLERASIVAVVSANDKLAKLQKRLDALKIQSKKKPTSELFKETMSLFDEYKNLVNKMEKIRAGDFDSKDISKDLSGILEDILKGIFLDLVEISRVFSCNCSNKFKIDYNNKIKAEFLYTKKNSNGNVFVETPLILEFKKFMNQEKGKTPYHIESLLNILATDYSPADTKQNIFIKEFTKKSKEIIGGDIESSGDSFVFNQEGGKNYDILNTSSGTKSIGLLQYLVTNKALKRGSVLYWEEPEVHLHPAWQLKMVDLFVELMNAGVKIVFSTHSPYMCDYLNAISQKGKFDDRVSFNLFKENDGVVANHILESSEEWNMIQEELLDPLEEIMWEYI